MGLGAAELLLIFVIIGLALAYMCGAVAKDRGHSFWPFFIGGLIFWPVSLALALILKPSNV